MWISSYVCIFIAFSALGWVYESALCTFKNGKWENRGFLYGPVCPIYGAGTVLILAIIKVTETYGLTLLAWQVFAISTVGSAILEYVTSWSLERMFHALWWDYSSLPLNLHGRISLFTSLGFGAAGVFIVYGIAPVAEYAVQALRPLVIECLALLFVAILSMDLTLTVTALLHFDRIVIRTEDAFNQNMTAIVDHTIQKTAQIKSGIRTTQKTLNTKLGMMSEFGKDAVRRVTALRYEGEGKERANSILRAMKTKNDTDCA